MENSNWTRIPVPIDSETDRRTMAAILISLGLEVRIMKARVTKSGATRKFIEYRLPTTEAHGKTGDLMP